ncbi:MAG TPA: hypothetical protein VJA19_13820 [Pseudomonas sp.]|nr:hypothetical protein [Pseudomonas sp.]
MTNRMPQPAFSILLLVVTLLLGGCDKDFATLTFERSVRSPHDRSGPYDGQLLPIYHAQLTELMRAQGIDPDMLTPRITDSLGRRLVLSEPAFGGLDTAQKAKLQSALEAIIEARKAQLDILLVIHPDAMQDTEDGTRERALKLPREYEGRFSLDEVSLSVALGMGDMLDAALKGSLKMQSEGFCNVTAKLNPALPFVGLRASEGPGSPYRHALKKNLSGPYSGDMIPVEINFKDPALQSLMSKGRLNVSSSLSDSSRFFPNKRGLSQFEFLIGPLGNVDHENAKVDFYSHVNMEVRCEEMASALGRPFSYKLGDSLDRLDSVVFY